MQKVTLEGNVSYDGKPVNNGEIRFQPIEGTPGPVSGAPIVDGRYRAIAKGGVPVGKHLVRVEAYDTTKASGAESEMTAGGRAGARVNYLPPKYHRDSQLTIDVNGDETEMTHDFELNK